jgi:hypothetical protein
MGSVYCIFTVWGRGGGGLSWVMSPDSCLISRRESGRKEATRERRIQEHTGCTAAGSSRQQSKIFIPLKNNTKALLYRGRTCTFIYILNFFQKTNHCGIQTMRIGSLS